MALLIYSACIVFINITTIFFYKHNYVVFLTWTLVLPFFDIFSANRVTLGMNDLEICAALQRHALGLMFKI